MIDLGTLRTEYESAVAEMDQQRRIYDGYVRARDDAASALVAAIQEAGLTGYGPITSSLEGPIGTFGKGRRRVWKTKADAT